jgi:hypothetical protein
VTKSRTGLPFLSKDSNAELWYKDDFLSRPTFEKDKEGFLGRELKEKGESNESQCIYTPYRAIWRAMQPTNFKHNMIHEHCRNERVTNNQRRIKLEMGLASDQGTAGRLAARYSTKNSVVDFGAPT